MKKYLRFIIRIGIINIIIFSLIIIILKKEKAPTPILPTPLPRNVINTSVSPSANNTTSNDPNITPTENAPVEAIPTPQDLFAELSKHNVQGDCWISYQGHIFNITSYFGSHPGGDPKLLKYCGNDATAGFDSKDSNPGRPHSAAALSQLQQLMIQ